VPAAAPWGACLGDLNAALGAARRAYREAHGLDENWGLPDDAMRIRPVDDEIVISFTIESEARDDRA
jgi:hypothetical protein